MNGVLGRVELLKPLRHRPYRLLFAGQLISEIGDWLTLLALVSVVVYRWDLGTAGWGAILIALTLPYAVVGPVAGVWVDRLPRRTVMIACDLARAAVVLGFLWAPNIPTVIVLVVVAHSFGTFFGPARAATVRSTVPDEDLLAASALGRFGSHTGRVVGPALGGALVALFGAEAVFVADAATFLASAVLLSQLSIGTAAPAPTGAAKRPFWEDLPVGVAYIRQRPILALGVGAMIIGQCLTRATDSMAGPVFKGLGVDEAGLGVLMTGLGIGYIGGAAAVGQWGKRLHPLSTLGLATLSAGGLLALQGTALLVHVRPPVVGWLPLAILLGAAYASLGVAYGYILQRETPADLMGRVNSSANALTTALPLFAPPVVALLAERLGLAQVYTATAVATAGVGLAIVLARPAGQLPTPETEVASRSVPSHGIVRRESVRRTAATDQ